MYEYVIVPSSLYNFTDCQYYEYVSINAVKEDDHSCVITSAGRLASQSVRYGFHTKFHFLHSILHSCLPPIPPQT